MKNPVLTKSDFVKRYQAGEFGNASPTWDTYDEYIESGYTGTVHYRNRVIGGEGRYDVQAVDSLVDWLDLTKNVPESNLYISAMAPTDRTIIQGEVKLGPWGYNLTYTTVRKPMRDALKESTIVRSGILAQHLLEIYLCSKSKEWLDYLLEEYTDHVVEFSTYEIEWGTVSGYNTVFWEIRRY